MTAVPNTKYKYILSGEESWAKAVAHSVLAPKKISVWEVLIPIIFILNFIKSSDERESFVKNLLFTKKLALEAALDMIKKDRSKKEVMSGIEDTTADLLRSPDMSGIYSEKIRRSQLEEIDLLLEHYCRLLRVDGTDYASLVINTYHGLNEYTSFLKKLGGIERKVILAALNAMGPKADTELVSKIENAANMTRMRGAEKIFGNTG